MIDKVMKEELFFAALGCITYIKWSLPMSKMLNFFKMASLMALFVSLKLLSHVLVLDNIIIYFLLEFFSFALLAFGFCFLTDYSRGLPVDRLRVNGICGGAAAGAALLLSFTKLLLFNSIYIGIANLLIFALLPAAAFMRDTLFYGLDDRKSRYIHLSSIAYFALAKLILNTIIVVSGSSPSLGVKLLLPALFILLLFIIRALLQSLFIRGYVEHDGMEHIVFDRFKVGRGRGCHLRVEDHQAPRSTFFTLAARRGRLFVKPNFDIKLENRTTTDRHELSDGDTIKCCGDYYTVITNKGPFMKRFALVFFLSCFILLSAFSGDYPISNYDHSRFPFVEAYVSIEDQELFKEADKKYIVLKKIDDETAKINAYELEKRNFPVELILVLDVTGNMLDRYAALPAELKEFQGHLKRNGKSCRFGFITFADKEEDISTFALTENMAEVEQFFAQLTPIEGGDYEENPYAAILKLDEMSFSPESQKIVVLITDGPPHIKGDRLNGGDYSFESTEFISEYIVNSNYYFFTATYNRDDVVEDENEQKRFQEYKRLINGKESNFYDIESLDNLGSILDSLEQKIGKQVRVTFQVKSINKERFIKSKGQYEVKMGEDAIRENKLFRLKKISRLSFFNSLFENF